MDSKVHRIRYYNPKPQLINCISFNKTNKHIALARADASIEIWDLSYTPYLLKFIPGVENGSVEALGWMDDRLMSTGLGGALVEWDLQKLCVKNTVLLTGYAAWCLDIDPVNHTVAVGTEQGYVNLFSLENNEISYLKLFDKQEGRIMCCKFNSTGSLLATGSVDSIRLWQVQTGQAISRMSVRKRGRQTIVWCIAVLADNTLVSGDSCGRLIFWDGTLGEQIESFSAQKADILSITVSDDEKSIYFSGVDPVITNFIKVVDEKHNKAQWVKNVQRHMHEHDVRGLALNGEILVSVGVDGYLTLSSYPPKWVKRVPYMLPSPRSSVCPRKKLLLLRYSNYLEVWKLGSCVIKNGKVLLKKLTKLENTHHKFRKILDKDPRRNIIHTANMILDRQNKTLKLSDSAVKLVSVQSKGYKQMRCCELSPSGEFIIYSTDTHIRMLKLEIEEDQSNISLSKMMINGVPASCDRVVFTQDSRTMVVKSANTLLVLQVDPLVGATLVQNINLEKYLKTTSILHLYLSNSTASGATYLVAADTLGAISVWTKGNKKFEHYTALPTYKCVPSALTVDSKRDNLIVAYVDQKVVEYELINRKFTEWLNTAMPPEWYNRTSAVTSIIVHPRRDALIFKDETSLSIMERKPCEEDDPSGRKSKDVSLEIVPIEAEEDEPSAKKSKDSVSSNVSLKVMPIKHLSDFHWVDDDEGVIIEILPENIVAQLPPIIMRK